MMGIYLPNMEMPKNHNHITITIWSNGTASYALHDRGESLVDFRNAEVVPVPPHGDLIDRDEMRETIKPWSPEDEMNGCTFDTVKKLMHTMISQAPVVIPAEEGE